VNLLRSAGMTALASAHAGVVAAIPQDRPVAYLDYSIAANVGDLLIMLGTLHLLRREGYRLRLSRNLYDTEARGHLPIEQGDTVVLQGGGNFGDLYPHFQNYRERIVSEYPDKKIVILPQTIFFRDQSALKRSAAVFAKHRDLKIFVRDNESLQIARKYFCADAELAPDMAHQLWPSIWQRASNAQQEKRSPLYLLRQDIEKGEQPEALLSRKRQFTDWSDLVSVQLRALKRLMRDYSKLQGHVGAHLGIEQIYFRLVSREVDRIMRKLFVHDIWITSRLHGLISGLLLAKPVFFIDNSYGKLSGYVDTWRDALDPVVRIRTAADAQRACDVAEISGSSDERLQQYMELGQNGIA
jgi:pyruvyl transferase EpsO